MRFILYYLAFLPLTSIGQVVIYNSDLMDSSKHQLFQYVENNLVIKSPQNIGQVKLVSSKSSIHLLGSNRFMLYPTGLGADTIKVYVNKKLIYSSVFSIDSLPDLVVRVGYSPDTILTVKQILLNPYLTVLFPGSNYKGNFYIQSFSVTIEDGTGEILVEESVNSNLFTANQLNSIKGLQPGSKLHFPNTRGGGPDSRLLKYPPFTITIK